MKLRYERTRIGWNAIAGYRGHFAEAESEFKDVASLQAVARCFLLAIKAGNALRF